MKVEIFRRTVKDRKRGNSYELLYHLKKGIEAAGDEAVIVNENRSGPTVEGEMTPTAPMAAMFGFEYSHNDNSWCCVTCSGFYM